MAYQLYLSAEGELRERPVPDDESKWWVLDFVCMVIAIFVIIGVIVVGLSWRATEWATEVWPFKKNEAWLDWLVVYAIPAAVALCLAWAALLAIEATLR